MNRHEENAEEVFNPILEQMIEGVEIDARALAEGMKVDITKELEGLLTEDDSYSVKIPRGKYAALKLVSAIGAAKWAKDFYLHNDHFAACVYALIGQKAVSSAAADFLGIQFSAPITPEKISALQKERGTKGGRNRHKKHNELKEWTLECYRTGKWPSANKAAHALLDDVLAKSKEISADISEDNAQRTIAEWIRASKKTA